MFALQAGSRGHPFIWSHNDCSDSKYDYSQVKMSDNSSGKIVYHCAFLRNEGWVLFLNNFTELISGVEMFLYPNTCDR